MEIKEEFIIKARQQIADNCNACIEEAVSGKVKVNDLESYIYAKFADARLVLSGEYDHTFHLRQLAYYLQTGECIALLPKR